MLTQINNLPPDHPAHRYLANRGYDVNLLSHVYQVCYCLEARSDFRTASQRIIIPIVMRGQMRGWQARYVGNMTTAEWRNCGIPKYYNRPGMHKAQLLYGYDVATNWQFVVVVESATSVWRIGGPAVAILGKTLSFAQQELLRAWEGKPVVVILDSDARNEMAAALDQLLRQGRSPVVPIYLPAGYDPADYPTTEIWQLIQTAATHAGVLLPTNATQGR